MVKTIDAVVAQTAMRSAWRSEDFACKAVLEFNRLSFDQYLLGARRWPKGRAVERVGHFCIVKIAFMY